METNFGYMPLSTENGVANTFVFCVTEDCNLRCRYCYCAEKNKFKKMDFAIAKKAIDYFVDHHHLFKESTVAFEFIGGEPLLEIDLIDQISDYAKLRMFENNHPWFQNYYFHITTNGLLYSSSKVQDYIKKNRRHVSITLSIDGNREKHNMQRVYPNGKGSYDDVIKHVPLWLSQFPNQVIKATFTHDDIHLLADSIISLFNTGIKKIAANCVFEDVWSEEDPIIFEQQLKELADYIIDNNIFKDHEYFVRFFDPNVGLPMSDLHNKKNFCGAGKIIAIDCDGNFFPCHRFIDFTLKKHKFVPVGNVNTGLDIDRLKPFNINSIGKMNDDECNECSVASGCMNCVALCYDETGTIFKKLKYNCKMHKANVRAIEYFWQRVDSKLIGNNPRKISRDLYNKSFQRFLIIYTNNHALSHCYYSNQVNSKFVKLSEKTIEDALVFAKKYYFTPIFIGETNPIYESFTHILKECEARGNKEILVFENESGNNQPAKVSILHIDPQYIPNLCNLVQQICEKHKSSRINIFLRSIDELTDVDIIEYGRQLLKLVENIIYGKLKAHLNIFDSVFRHPDFTSKCDCGINTLSVAPNGKIYTCPGLYFYDETLYIAENVQELSKQISFKIHQNQYLVNNDKQTDCASCLYINKSMTNEYAVKPHIYCKLIEVERMACGKLKQMLNKEVNFYESNLGI